MIRASTLATLIVITTAQFAQAQGLDVASDQLSTTAPVTSGQQPPLGIPGLPAGGGIGGPASVTAQFREERVTGPTYRFPGIDNAFQPWIDFKSKLNEEYRLQIGFDYNTLYQGASETLTGNDDAASGIFRMYGDWTLFGETEKTAGSLIFKGENRHKFGTDIPPSQLGFDAGYLGIPGILFSDVDWALTNLYWEQFLFDGRAGFVMGLLEPDSYADVSGYGNPWATFQNFAAVVNPTIPFPDPGFGAAGGFVIDDQWLIKGGFYDANAVISEFEFYEGGSEFFSHLDLSWSPSRAERYLKEFHVTGWHADKRETADVPESWGIAIGANWTFCERWMPFFRAGWSDGEAPLMHRSLTSGFLYYFPYRGDLTGVVLTWEDPADRSLNEQNTFEYFYRVQLSKSFAITPSVQVLINPALNPDDNAITIFGVRGRLTF